MLHQTLPILGQLWQLFEVSQILEFLRYVSPQPVAGETKPIELSDNFYSATKLLSPAIYHGTDICC